MNIKNLIGCTALAIVLVGCESGEIAINADSVNNSVDNSVKNSNNTSDPISQQTDIVCAEYTDQNSVQQAGQSDGQNCYYSESFVNYNKPLMSSITLRDIGEGAHIFQGSLFVGQNYSTLSEASTAGITKGGDGPTLTIQAGATVALQDAEDFIAIMRGSQIIAKGSPTHPITFTSESDINGLVSPEQVQSWGGMVINGFGYTNACVYAAGWDPTDSTTNLTLEAGQSCSIAMEGAEGERENSYGGTVENDNSGTLSYVIVKHAGFEVVEGNELNGITFGAVGSGTTLNNVEIYSNKDDGVEFFGGSVNLNNYVAMYVRDDSIDIDEGYFGTITNALVIQGGGLDESSKTGAHCVESDGSASSTKADNITKGYVSKATINNLTCIISAKGPGVAGNSDPGAGINAEEGHNLTLNNAIVTTAYAIDATTDGSGGTLANLDFQNYCFQLEDDIDKENAGNGLININTSIFACADISAAKARDGDFSIVAGTSFAAMTGQAFLEAQDNVVYQTPSDGSMPPNAGDLTILDGFYSVPVVNMIVGGSPVSFADTSVTKIGAVSKDNDWTAGWTYGLHDGSRGQDLWFEQ